MDSIPKSVEQLTSRNELTGIENVQSSTYSNRSEVNRSRSSAWVAGSRDADRQKRSGSCWKMAQTQL
jgi:hypothetical protein